MKKTEHFDPTGERGSSPEKTADGADSNAASSPLATVNLPKGGGAIKGIGEKFAANPVTGTGSMSVPIATSPGRGGFGPALSLSYDSGAGNGPFGFGWRLSAPSITRKTDKGLPRYFDAEASDVFILSGAEDLVPVLEPNGDRFEDTATFPDYTIHRYRPRIEGLFARIERWTRKSDGDVHWRSITKDNILTLYGRDDNSRIADPERPDRTFSWLISETRDDKGNAVVYEYKPEDGAGVSLTRASERNRGDENDSRRTANRYLKRIRYGNRTPLLDPQGKRPALLTTAEIEGTEWLFEAVFDYGEHDPDAPTPGDTGEWGFRGDPFSSYRSGFEVRTTRLCDRVLMFHHFSEEEGVGTDCLVRSTDFTYSHEQDPLSARNPVYTFLKGVTQSGYKRDGESYVKKSLPPVAFEYTEPEVQETAEAVDAESLENLPAGVDGLAYQWTDLHGEGIPGILTEQAGAWFYKRNLSPISDGPKLAPMERVAVKPNLTLAGGAQFMDLAGDGQPDLVMLGGPVPGLFEHDEEEGWQPFRPFKDRLNREMQDPNLKLVDLNGDGHADVLITEDDAFVWHPSLGEKGFGPASRVHKVLDEEKGPQIVFADATESIHLADLSGDGLSDIARIRNGEVCYWPNLGYGRFGAKITMDGAPWFDPPDQFDPKRLRLADIDGSGTTDIIYLRGDGVRLYFNQSGNGWSEPQVLKVFPRVDDLTSIVPTDLLGNGTACLVWSSSLPGDRASPMRFVNLMGAHKPHLLVKTANNLGAETRVDYAPSTKFYLQDKRDGRPWITRLPFPVHVVERVETYDRISRNRFVTRYAYHHGYFDGEEREFRGFGMVEQWDTEEMAALTGDGTLPEAVNIDNASHVPPVHTKTWFHTGAYLGRKNISNYFAGLIDENDTGEYYREPDKTDAEAEALLLPDTVLPEGLGIEEEREACRSLKGAMLRQEVYALDGTDKEAVPYTVAEQNFAIRQVQPRGENRHAVFLTHPREALTYHYERNPEDPRTQHALTLEVDDYGNVLRELSVGYGRRSPDYDLPQQADRDKQTKTLVTYTENRVTNPIDSEAQHPLDYRAPLPAETRTYELTGFELQGNAVRFSFEEWTENDFARIDAADEIPYEQTANGSAEQKRLIEQVRSLYRKDDLSGHLPLGTVEPLALPGESYKLAFTPGLLAQVFVRDGQPLLPAPETVLGGKSADQGGYVRSQDLKQDGAFPQGDPDDHWWIPSGRVFLSPGSNDAPNDEKAYATEHFFLPQRARDPFHTNTVSTESIVTYDAYDLMPLETEDALGNRVTAGERQQGGAIDPSIDYRVLQPRLMTGINGNRSEVTFDILGMVTGTAVMGKPGENLGDSLDGFDPDLTEQEIDQHLTDPLNNPHAILGKATTRLVYDLFAYERTKNDPEPQCAVVYAMARETHDADLEQNEETKVQHSFSYSDGFGREIQKKIQAEPEKTNGNPGPPRWVGSGWTIFNNKGKPVRQYEPFFSATHQFEFGVEQGVSPVLFYDPVERVVATLLPNQTYEKVTFDPWKQTTWDVNDTVLGDPRTDTDIEGYTKAYFDSLPPSPPWQTWYEQRAGGAEGPNEQKAAQKAAAHADTPTVAHFDTLGRPFLTTAHNKVVCPNHDKDGTEELTHSRVELDIEGNQREVRDGDKQSGDDRGRIVMRYDQDMLGNQIHQASMEAGEGWSLNDITGNPIRAWDSREHTFRTEYDLARRPVRSFVTGADPDNPSQELLTDRMVYGDQLQDAEQWNLRGQLYLQLDQAGAVTTEAVDFKGNALSATRRLAIEYKKAIDWSPVDAALPADAKTPLDPTALEAALAPMLEAETFTSETTFDALNRPITLTSPHTPTMQANTLRPGYNEANLLEKIDVRLQAAETNGQPDWTPFVTNIDYDAKGQRQRIDYGNGVSTEYEYDPQTFRLKHLLTKRNATTFPGDNPSTPNSNWPGTQVQNLHYTYDPAGNITNIKDDAQQKIFFNQTRVEPSNDYTYDAIYRLIEATGREHLGQGGDPLPHTDDDGPRINRHHPNDGNAMARYIERYVYDVVGNFEKMQHRGSHPTAPGWTRTYEYKEQSLLEQSKYSNRLSKTQVGGATPLNEPYSHDAHGNMT